MLSTKYLIWLLTWLGSISLSVADEAYHYSDFNGPVSGSAEQITVPKSVGNNNPYKAYLPNDYTFDYVARPDYRFSFGVNDPFTRNSQKHEESRDGDVVHGEYSLLEPDGSIRRVVYRADPENGFQATVLRTPAPSTIAPPAFPLSDPLADLANLPLPNDIPSSPATDPAYFPSPSDTPTYPSAPDDVSYPTAADSPSYPTAADSPSYPTAADSPSYPTAADSSSYPTAEDSASVAPSDTPSYAVYEEGSEYEQ